MDKNIFYYLGLVTQLGLVIASSIFIGLAIGLFIDKKLHINGIFSIIFLLFGVMGGFIAAYELIKTKEKVKHD